MTNQDLKSYLVREAEMSESSVERMSPRDLVKEWLEYEGIIGYTNQIIGVIEGAYNIELD